jgi:hypothetical protein
VNLWAWATATNGCRDGIQNKEAYFCSYGSNVLGWDGFEWIGICSNGGTANTTCNYGQVAGTREGLGSCTNGGSQDIY